MINEYSQIPSNPINHYINKHGGVPVWVVIQFMYFGDVIKMLKCCNAKIQSNVAREFSKFMKENCNDQSVFIEPSNLLSILYEIKDIRNIVAHNNRLFNYCGSHSIPYIKSIHDPLGIPASSSKTDLYNTYVIMKCLISKNEFSNMHNSIRKRFKDLKRTITCIDYNRITYALGFPKDWYDNTSTMQQPH